MPDPDIDDFIEAVFDARAKIDYLETSTKYKDSVIEMLFFTLDTYGITIPLHEIANVLSDKISDAQEEIITDQTTKIDKYTKGPKQKSAVSQEKWALANEYLKEEIPKNKTRKAARSVAAKKAGIVVEERQLTKMMPIPRKIS